MPGSHRKRFANWRRLGGRPLMTMATLVEKHLVSRLLDEGFEWVDAPTDDSEWPVSGSEIVLERMAGDDLHVVSICFEKYRAPAFQIGLTTRKAKAPYELVRATNLVRQSSKYYQFWGKPWWWPKRLWADRRSEQAVLDVLERLPDGLDFLQSGRRGASTSRPVRPTSIPGLATTDGLDI